MLCLFVSKLMLSCLASGVALVSKLCSNSRDSQQGKGRTATNNSDSQQLQLPTEITEARGLKRTDPFDFCIVRSSGQMISMIKFSKA